MSQSDTIERCRDFKITEKRRKESRHLTQSPEYKAAALIRSKAWKVANAERNKIYNKLRQQRMKIEREALAAGNPIPSFPDLPRLNSSKLCKVTRPNPEVHMPACIN
jgi:hypothetical protein